MGNVLNHTVHRPAEQLLVLVVHGQDDKELRAPGRIVMHLTQSEAIIHEIIWVRGRGRITHVRKFALIALGAHIQQFAWYCRVENEVSMEEPDRVNK
jgi:hypothetical protein